MNAPLRSSSALMFLFTLGVSLDVAAAQEPAPAPAGKAVSEGPTATGTVGAQAPASGGAANLDENKFATAAAPAETMDATEAEVSAGGLFTAGNARSAALTGGGRLRLRRKIHEFQAAVFGNYARAGSQLADGTRTSQLSVGNVQGRVRYDVYFHPRVTFFTMVTGRFDPFLGLDLRLRVDPGFAFYILNKPKHRLWAEVGYDFLYDKRRIRGGADTSLCPDGTSFVLNVPNTTDAAPLCAARRGVVTHSGRLFAGYSNILSDHVTLNTGLEYIQAFAPARSTAAETDGGVARLKSWVNWDVGVTTAIGKRFALATTFTLRYDNAPLPGIRKLDMISAFSLVFRFV